MLYLTPGWLCPSLPCSGLNAQNVRCIDSLSHRGRFTAKSCIALICAHVLTIHPTLFSPLGQLISFQASSMQFQMLCGADKRSKEQKKADAKKLAVQRKEDERLKEKERKWQVEQRRLKVLKAEEEAEEVRQKLLRAQLGPTPTTAGMAPNCSQQYIDLLCVCITMLRRQQAGCMHACKLLCIVTSALGVLRTQCSAICACRQRFCRVSRRIT